MRQYSNLKFKSILRRNGYWCIRVTGSHFIYTNSMGNTISVPLRLKSVIALRLIKENQLLE